MAFNVEQTFANITLAKAGEDADVQLVDISFDRGTNAGKQVRRVEIRKNWHGRATRECVALDDVTQLDALILALQDARAAISGPLGTAKPVARKAVQARKPTPQARKRSTAAKKPAPRKRTA